MAGISLFKSTPQTITRPHLKLGDGQPTERLEKVQNLLRQGGEGTNLFATKINGETILYIARDAKDSRQLKHDKGFRDGAARAQLARQELGDILRACVKDKIVDGTAKGAYDGLNAHKAEMRGLLSNAIDNTTRTTETPVTDGFAPPEGGPGQGEGRTRSFFSFPSMTWFRSLGRSAPTPDILKTSEARNLNNIVAEFGQRFERFDAADKAAQGKVPDFPPTDNTDTMLTKNLDGIDEPFPILDVGGKMFEPIERLGAGSYGQVLRYRCEETGETKVVKLARERPDDPAKTPEENKAVRDYYQKKHLNESAFELNAGQKFAQGRPNVLGFTEHVMLSNDTVALIGDDAGGGDIAHFAGKLHAQFREGAIGLHELRLVALTLTRDVTQGVASLKAAGAVHGDMKPGNQVIDANGEGHLIDLGFTEAGKITMRGHLLANSSYNAPEAERLLAHKRAGAKDSPIPDNHLVPPVKRLHLDLAELVSPEHRERAAGLTGVMTYANEGHAAELLGEGDFGIDSRADVFGAGITLTHLMTGKFPSDIRAQQQLWETEKVADFKSPEHEREMLAAAAKSKVDAASNKTMKGVSYAGGSANGYINPVGDAPTDALLNDMLAPNRDNRMEAEQVLEHPSMSYAAHDGVRAVGSPEVRNLIKAIASGDEMEIAMAAEVLRAVHPDPFPAPQVFGGMVPPPPPGPGPDAAASMLGDVPPPPPPSTGGSHVTPLEPLLEPIPTIPTPPTVHLDPPPPPPLSSSEWSPSQVETIPSSEIPPPPPRSADPRYFETGGTTRNVPPPPPGPDPDLAPDGKRIFKP